MAPTEPKIDSPPRKRRWFQYSLRTLLIIMLLASIGLSWVAVRMQNRRKQKEAVQAIKALGGYVEYDYEADRSGKRLANAEPPGPACLRSALGDDFFAKAVFAGVSSEAALEHLEGLSHLRGLALVGPGVTDAWLEQVRGLSQLEQLHLARTQVTDAGLENLKECTQLRVLILDGTQVTDAGLRHLKALPALQRLDLGNTRVTDAGLEHLRELSQLTYLDLLRSPVTDDGVRGLQEALPNCLIRK